MLRNNFAKEEKDLYTKKYKTLLKEIKEDTDKWKDIPCLQIRHNILKMSILPKVIYRFSVKPIKTLVSYFLQNRKTIPLKIQGLPISQNNL